MQRVIVGDEVRFEPLPLSFSLERRIERWTQKHLKLLILAIFLIASLYANVMMAKTLISEAHMGQYCAVWASKSGGYAVNS